MAAYAVFIRESSEPFSTFQLPGTVLDWYPRRPAVDRPSKSSRHPAFFLAQVNQLSRPMLTYAARRCL